MRLLNTVVSFLFISSCAFGQAESSEPSGTPAAVKEVLKQLDDEVTEIQNEVDKKINARKWAGIRQLMILQDKLCKAGRLEKAIKIRDHIRQITTETKGGIQEAPQYLTNLRNTKIGSAFLFKVKGVTTGGYVYGTNIYTIDTHLGMAAVHSGAVKNGETGIVKVTLLGPQKSFTKSTKNGITSYNYGQYGSSYKVEPVSLEPTVTKEVLEDPGTLHAFRGKVGKTLKFEITGSSKGTIYGTDIYTDDSDLATAAVHAGILKEGEKGVVLVTILEGKNRYKSSLQNGITSKQWDGWVSSYRVSKAQQH